MRRLFPLAAAAMIAPALVATPAQAASTATFARWSSTAELGQGTRSGTVAVANGAMTLTSGTSGAWTSPWKSAGSGQKSLVPSWSVATPAGTKLVVEARVKSGSTVGSWDVVGTWAMTTDWVKRASSSSQTDDLTKVSTDTVVANSGKSFDAWQVRVTLARKTASTRTPTVYAVNGVAAPFTTRSRSTSATTMTKTVDLSGVPRASQMIHKKHGTAYDGGGAAWCSPTSVSMVLGYAGLGPKASAYAYTKESQGYVDYAAKSIYDYRYEGTGNWAFSTAYAAAHGADAFVTRLDSLAEAEKFIKAGIPVVVSIVFSKGGLTGSPLTSTPGHLLVIRGFRADGAVIVNDPAAPSNSSVGRIYSRAQLEKAWQQGSGGITYVVRKATTPLPAGTTRWAP